MAEKEQEKALEASQSYLSNASIAPEDFNWEAFESETVYDKPRAEIEADYEKTLSKVKEDEVVEGIVTSINKKEVIVNVGGKSEGAIAATEFRYNEDLKVGDTVEVYIQNAENRLGQLVLSHRKARNLRAWDRVNEAFNAEEVVKGYVKSRTKGGMIVDVLGIEAFLPGSQIDVKPIRDYDQFVNTTMELKIIKINPEGHNVVVSHKILIEAELEAQKSEIMSRLEKGQVLEGTVKNITDYGVFIDLGGVDGLIHITDLSWGRITHPKEILELDQKINVVILDFDEGKKRIALGLKQLTPHPWDSLDPDLKAGDKIKGKVVLVQDYGAFVEVAPGVEGLIHVSEMSWSPRLRTASEFVKQGQEIEAQILSIDRDEKKMSLGLKQLTPNPWDNIAEKYPVGSTHSAVIRNITSFGVFVELEDGVDSLVHISDLSWEKIKHPSELFNTGDKIDVIVLDIDAEGNKLNLGHKQLTPNPWEKIEKEFPVGAVVPGKVTAIAEKSATIELSEELSAVCPIKELVKEDGSTPAVGDSLDFKVTDFKRNSKRLTVSHVKTYATPAKAEAEAEAEKKVLKKINDSVEKTTFGDLEALADMKKQLEK